jgi:folate-binding protein YgfZ
MPDDLLQNWHEAQPDVETADFGGVPIVITYGSPQAEYAAIHNRCGLMDLPHRGVIEFTGKDRHAFLGNLISNKTFDLATKTGMSAGTGVNAFLLNLKGRVVAELNLIERGDRLLLETDVRQVAMLQTLFDRYLFAEQVKMKSLVGSHRVLALLGPGAEEIVKGASALPAMGSMETTIQGVPVTAWRDDVCGSLGLFVLVSNVHAMGLWQQLVDAEKDAPLGKRKLRPVGWAAFNSTRIEAGRLIAGIDYEPAEPSMPGKKKQGDEVPESPAAKGILPAETGQTARFVDFAKGCYLGQEIVARMHARQQVARQIVGFKMNSEHLPLAGAAVYDETDLQVGIVTSSTMSPILSDAAIGLMLVKKPWFEAGKVLRIAAEGAFRPATVVGLPFAR